MFLRVLINGVVNRTSPKELSLIIRILLILYKFTLNLYLLGFNLTI